MRSPISSQPCILFLIRLRGPTTSAGNDGRGVPALAADALGRTRGLDSNVVGEDLALWGDFCEIVNNCHCFFGVGVLFCLIPVRALAPFLRTSGVGF